MQGRAPFAGGGLRLRPPAVEPDPEQQPMTREQQLTLIYRHTPRKFRGTIDRQKFILYYIDGATCLVPLHALTDEQIADQLPYALLQEAKRKVA
jgi:hypothetical protein